MKVLIISSRCPIPPENGYTIAVNNLIKGLFKTDVDYTVLSINTSKHFINTEAYQKVEYMHDRFTAAYINTDINPIKAFANLFGSKSYNVERFSSKNYINAIKDILNNNTFDIILLEGLYATKAIDIIKQKSKAKIVFRAHNVEHIIWQRMAENPNINPLKRAYFKLLANRLKSYETDFVNNKIDLLLTFSQNDMDIFVQNGYTKHQYINPIGIDTGIYSVKQSPPIKKRLFYIASFDWMPNEQGLLWFAENIWTALKDQFPDTEFVVGGRYMSDEIERLKEKGIKIVGEVPNAIDFINNNDIMIVPLLAGSGIRVKILEAMAAGKVVISTSVGAEGIRYTNFQNIIIANNKEEFIDALTILGNQETFNNISTNARKLIENEYANQIMVNNLVQKFKELTQ